MPQNHALGGTKCLDMLSWPPSVKFAGLSTQQATQNKLPATPKSKLKSRKTQRLSGPSCVRHDPKYFSVVVCCWRECVRHTPKPAHALATDMRTPTYCMSHHSHSHLLTHYCLYRSRLRPISLAHFLFFFQAAHTTTRGRAGFGPSRPRPPWVPTILEPWRPPRRHGNPKGKQHHLSSQPGQLQTLPDPPPWHLCR
jgi:hypothetical protein